MKQTPAPDALFAGTELFTGILDRVLHHCTVINIKGESYRLKERKEFMRREGDEDNGQLPNVTGADSVINMTN